MVKDAFYFILPLLALAALCAGLGLWLWCGLLLAAAAFVAFFFRNPSREVPPDPSAIVSPADGKVVRLERGGDGGLQLSIFLSIFDVHVNRAPIGGRIVRQDYHPGRFRPAFDERASLENERLAFAIEEEGRQLNFSLVAGLVARRIVPWTSPGDQVAKGDRIGLIRFGSRVDIFLPPECDPEVKKGDRVSGGSSVIARWSP